MGINDLHDRNDDDFYKVREILSDKVCEDVLDSIVTYVDSNTYGLKDLCMVFDACYSSIKGTNVNLRIKALNRILEIGHKHFCVICDYVTDLKSSTDYVLLEQQQRYIANDLLMVIYAANNLMSRLEDSHKELYSNLSVKKIGGGSEKKVIVDGLIPEINRLRTQFIEYMTHLFKNMSGTYHFLSVAEESGYLNEICEMTVTTLLNCLDHRRFAYKDEKDDLIKIFRSLTFIIKCLKSSQVVGVGLSKMFEDSQIFCSFANFHFIDAMCDIEENFRDDAGCFEGVYVQLIKFFSEKAPMDLLKEGCSKVFISSLKSLTERRPKLMLKNISELSLVLFSECNYMYKNCVLSILGQLVIKWSEIGDHGNIKTRRFFIEKILSFSEDKSSLIRSKCLSILRNIIEERALGDGPSDIGVVKILSKTLMDEQTSVRKVALQALRELLQKNPYSETLSFNFVYEKYLKALTKLDVVNSDHFSFNKDEILHDVTSICTTYRESKDLSKYRNVPLDYLPSLLDDEERINYCATYIKENIDFRVPLDINKVSSDIFNFVQGHLKDDGTNSETNLITRQCFGEVVQFYNKLSFIRQMEDSLEKVLSIAFTGSIYEVKEALSLLCIFKQFGIDNSITSFRKICRLAFRKEEVLQREVFKCLTSVCISKHDDIDTRYKSTLQNVMEILIGDEELQPGVEEAITKLIICTDTIIMDKKMFELLYSKYINSEEYDSTNRLAAMRLIKILSRSKPTMVKERLDDLKNLFTNESNPSQFHVEILEIIYRCAKNSHDLTDNKCFLLHFNDDLLKFLFSELQKNFDNQNYALWISIMQKFVAIVFDICYETTFIISEFFQVCLKKLEFHLRDQVCLEQLHDDTVELLGKGDDLTMTTALKHKIESTKKFICYRNKKVDLVAIRLLEFVAEVGLRFTVYNDKVFVQTCSSILDTLKKLKNNAKNSARKFEEFRGEIGNLTTFEQEILNNEGLFHISGNLEMQDEAFDQGLPSDEYFKGIAINNANNEAFLEGRLLERMMHVAIFICLSEKFKKDEDDSINCFSKESVNSAFMALARLALINDTICSRIMVILFDKLSKTESHTKINLLITITDLLIRFPNNVDPFSGHIIKTVLDEDIRVRYTSLSIVIFLILKNLLNFQKSITDVARRLLDKDDVISSIAQYFFHELMKEDKETMKIIPELISELIFRRYEIPFEEYQSIVYFVLSLVEKDSISDYLINIFCDRLKSNTSGDEVQRVETAKRLIYSISLLDITEKSFKYISMALPNFSSLILIEQEICEFFKVIVDDVEKLYAKTNLEDIKDMCSKFLHFANRLIDGDSDNVAENEEQQQEYYKEIVERSTKPNRRKRALPGNFQ
uniref:Condensin complex subunit 1 (inferred by orthology to a human protein) n=1 Tax=Strongyloides venezuelensis TaxID=75913 RepID=A0A0K0G0A5_STRVS